MSAKAKRKKNDDQPIDDLEARTVMENTSMLVYYPPNAIVSRKKSSKTSAAGDASKDCVKSIEDKHARRTNVLYAQDGHLWVRSPGSMKHGSIKPTE